MSEMELDCPESEKLLPEEGTREEFDVDDPLASVQKGLSCVAALFFVVGNILGAGIIALPHAARLASWYSVPMLIVVAIVTAICGILLAKAVNEKVVGEKENGDVTRDPYPLLAENAVGKKARVLVTVVMNIGLVMSCIVFLLLAGEILSKLMPFKIINSSNRHQLQVWFVVTGTFLLPFTLLGSPKEFWGIALIATLTSLVSAILILACLGIISIRHAVKPVFESATGESVFAAFGTFLFGFAGIGIFPTVQSDMKDPLKFQKIVASGFAVVACIYILVSLTSYVILGNLIGEDLLTSLTKVPVYHHNIVYRVFVTIAQVLICGHVLSAYVLNINPVHQQFEGYIGIPVEFCWQRCIIRSISMVLIIITAVVIPNFGPALSLLGGTLSTLLCIIFPIWFYICIEPSVRPGTKLLLGLIVVLALIAGAGNCFVEVKNLIKVIQGKYKSN